MTLWKISPSAPLKGTLRPPSSKSQTLRAILFASLSKKGGSIFYPLESADSEAMKKNCAILGAEFEKNASCLSVKPIPAWPVNSKAKEVLCFNAMNSGIVWRFLAGVLSTRPGLSIVWGDESILKRRPIQPLAKALRQRGVAIWQTQEAEGPCLLKGGWTLSSKIIDVDGFDSQTVSALLIAAALLEETCTEIRVSNPKEVEWAHLTVCWLRSLGIEILCDQEGAYYKVLTKSRWNHLYYHVPIDYSSSAFIVAATLITGGRVTLEGLFEDPQPDRALIGFLKKAGAKLNWDKTKGLLDVDGSLSFNGFDVDLSGPIDLLPVMMSLACYAKTPSVFRQIQGARSKESDRVSAMKQELEKMGAKIEVFSDSVRVMPSKLRGSSSLKGHSDHRVIMALAVASLGTEDVSFLDNTEWVNKTYPLFIEDLTSLGAQIQVST